MDIAATLALLTTPIAVTVTTVALLQSLFVFVLWPVPFSGNGVNFSIFWCLVILFWSNSSRCLAVISSALHMFKAFSSVRSADSFSPRPAGVWLVTRPAGGGGAKGPRPEISQTTGPISKFQTPFDSPVRELPVQGQKFDPEVTDDVTGQVKVKIFYFSDLVTSASKISMLSANKANESAWVVSLTSVSIIYCAL